MKTKVLAVFGHYDSRGGTTGIPLAEVTEESIATVIKEYNAAFGWEEEVARYKNNPEEWSWDPTKEGASPGETDFMYVADLHYPDDAVIKGDLEEAGVVLRQAEGPQPEPDKDMDGSRWHGKQPTCKELIAKSVNDRVQLEFVPLGKSRYESQGDIDDDVWGKEIKNKAQALRGEIEIPSWNDDAFGFIIGVFA